MHEYVSEIWSETVLQKRQKCTEMLSMVDSGVSNSFCKVNDLILDFFFIGLNIENLSKYLLVYYFQVLKF